MALDINGAASGLVKITRELVGEALSTINGPSGSTVPAVILNRSKTPQPDFPYAVVDHIGIRPVGYSAQASYIDENQDEVTKFDSIGRFFIQVHGSTDDDSLSICENLKSLLYTSKGKRLVKEHLLGYGLLKTEEVLFFPSKESTDFQEVSRFTLEIYMQNIITDTTADVITSIELDGELYQDFDQLELPLEVDINVP